MKASNDDNSPAPTAQERTGYELEPSLKPPKLPGSVIVRASSYDAIDAVACDVFLHAINCVRAFGDFHLALSGDPTLTPLYTQLMIDPNHRELPWRKTHLWLVSERRVDFDDARSAFGEIQEMIVAHSDIPRQQTHPIFPNGDDAAQLYERELRETLGWREKGHDRLDCVVLHVGDDGHTAGLFPGSDAVSEEQRFVRIADDARTPPPHHVTMTLPLLNASRLIAVVATGASKHAALTRAQGGDCAVSKLPIRGLAPIGGDLRWYLDHAACQAPRAECDERTDV